MKYQYYYDYYYDYYSYYYYNTTKRKVVNGFESNITTITQDETDYY